jgi:hypothetical protein
MGAQEINKPEIFFNITPASQTISNAPERILIIGQQTAAGTATSGDLQTNIGNDSSVWEGLYGEDSMLSGMIRASKDINGQTRTDAIGLDDNGAGTAATGTIVFAGGPATEDGTLTVIAGSEKDHSYEIAVAKDDTITDIGDALDVLVAADSKAPFSSANVTGTVTATFGHKGTVGNNMTLKVVGSVAGITHSVTAMSGGATDPVLTGLFDAIEGERYRTIIWPGNWGYTEIVAEMDSRFPANNKILDGVAISTLTDTFSNLETAGNAQNSRSLFINGNNLVNDTSYKGSAIAEFDYKVSAQIGAVRALRLTEDANISRYTATVNASRDGFGGPAISSLPYHNTPFFNLPVIDAGKGFDSTEVDDLGDARVSVLGNNDNTTNIIAGTFYTTRKTDAASNPEDTFKFLNNVDTSTSVREFIFNNQKATFSQTRLTDGDLQPNRNMANKESIEAHLDKLYNTLSGPDWVLTQAGEAARTFFKENRSATLELLTGTVTIDMKVPIVVGLRTIIETMQIAFSTE